MAPSNFPPSLRILYIEDDKNTQEEVAFFLEPLVEHLYLASNGQEGLDLYHLHAPDLIITDLQMPIMNGIDMIKQIRQYDSTTPIFITTAYNETTYLHSAINSGVNRYILKPINFKNLAETIGQFYANNAGHPYFVFIDQIGTIVNTSNSWPDMIGYTLDEVLYTPLEDYIAPQDRSAFHRFLKNIGSSQEHLKQKFLLTHKNETLVETVLYSIHAEHSDNNNPVFQLEFKTLTTYIHDEEHLNKTLKAERFIKGLIKMNSVIYKEIGQIREETEFLQHLANLYSKNDLFEFAFVTYADEDDLVQIAIQGQHKQLNIKSLFPNPIPLSEVECPMAEVIKNQGIVLIENLMSFSDFNTKTYWIDNEIQSMVILPLHKRSRTQKRGAFCFMLNKPYKLDNEVLELFENITDALNMGLQSIEDQTERHLLEKQLRQERNFISGVLQTAGNIIVVIDHTGSIIQFNQAAENISGYRFEEVTNKPFFWKCFLLPNEEEKVLEAFNTLMGGRPNINMEFHVVSKNGETRLFDWNNTILCDEEGSVEYIVSVGNDITERKKNADIIEQFAFFDPLTQLPNRRLFGDYLHKAIVSNKRSGHISALLFLDLDNFKPLNDTHGHALGDLLLIEVANRIKKCIRESDVVARFGGDEFVVVLHDLGDNKVLAIDYAQTVAEKIRATLAEPYFLSQNEKESDAALIEHHCTSSIGVILFGADESDQNKLIKQADDAMYQAKEAGRNQIIMHNQNS